MVNVENTFVGVPLTETGPKPFEMRRCAIEIHDVETLKQLRRFIDQQIQRME